MSESFMFQAIIYLVAAVIMVPIAKRLGLGSVLGYLIAGTLIGPSVLGFIGTEGQDIMHFAEFGVVMMLFLIGLELEPELLWKMRRSIAGLGGLQVVLTTAIITIIAIVAFNMPWQQALAVAMAVAMSSTAIVLQTMQEKGLMKSAAGQSSFSVLLFQDIAVIPMLAILPLLSTLPKIVDPQSHGTTNWVQGMPALQQMMIVLGSVVAIVLAGRFLIKPLLRIVARSKVRELFTASALLLVVSIAWLMQQVGLSPALGTFLAGVVLANSEFRHELESDIEPFKGLLLGLFFIAVGASIDIDIILQNPWFILGIVAGMMAIKALILLALGKLFKMSFDQNAIFSVALSQVGEFAFVLLSFCLTEGILPKYTIDVMMSVVAISMALTPLLWLLHERLILPRLGILEKDETKESDDTIE
ncbi:MAG TPA: potassium transporter, partial [Chitinophagaceae bacterium]|nr:potassium transporter [Chitinophagaceae bacterium]